MISFNSSKALNIALTNTNKALSEVISSASPKELAVLTQGKDLQSILNSLLKDSLQNPEQDRVLLNLLKNNPTLKTLGNVTQSLKELLSTLEQQTKQLPLAKEVKSFLQNIQTIDEKSIKTKVQDSGIFLENRLKNMLPVEKDLKAILLKSYEDINNTQSPNKAELLKTVDKLLLQIDYHQLLSHLSNSASLYIPYSWDALEEGELSIKSTKDGKFFTDIQLTLKEYGELRLRLGLFDKNQLNINITTKNEKFKKMLQESMPELKKQLFDAGLIPQSIRFIDAKEEGHSYAQEYDNLAMGFEVKA